jgi:hypothetical protein
VRTDSLNISDEKATSQVLEGMLREVDPLSIVDGEPFEDEPNPFEEAA